MTANDLKALQSQLKLNNRQLAHRLGYGYEMVSRWRTGKVRISHKAALKLLRLVDGEVCPWCGQMLPPDH